MMVIVLIVDSDIIDPIVFNSIESFVEYHEENDIELSGEDVTLLKKGADLVDATSVAKWVNVKGT